MLRGMSRGNLKEEEVELLLRKVKNLVSNQTPLDWRFTASPAAKFLLAYEPEKENLRLLGRSFRDYKGCCESILQSLKNQRLDEMEFRGLVSDYIKLMRNPNCEIKHELKTIYLPKQDLSDEKDIFNAVTASVSHVIPFEGKRVAIRPNAIITGEQIWVRQGEYFNLENESGKDYIEYLAFEQLTAQGVNHDCLHLYSIDRQGHLKLRECKNQNPTSIRLVPGRPGLRSQSYWTLPTLIDAEYMDVKYSVGRWSGDSTSYETVNPAKALLFVRLEALLRQVRTTLGGR